MVVNQNKMTEKAQEALVEAQRTALVAAAVLSHRYISDRYLPDKAIDLVDEAAAKLRVEATSMPAELDEVRRRIMQLEIEREGLRKEKDLQSRERLQRIEKELADLKEQSNALEARWKQELEQLNRVGELQVKIDAAKMEMEQASLRADWERAPPGYVGYDEAGQLTEAVRRRPYSVVLFDEVEKAHPEVLNVLLQLLDDGRLTDAQGRTVDFKNTIVIMTSNLGSQWITEVGLSWEEINGRVMVAVREHFRPELLNRIDDIVIFRPLGMEQIKKIVEIQLQGLRTRLVERKIDLELTEAAKELIAREGFDPVFGARPLKRTIQKEIIQPLAMRLLRGEFQDGDVILADAQNGHLTFQRAAKPAVAAA